MYTLARYLIERHGFDAVIRLIRAPGRYEEALGLTEDQLYDNWVLFLRQLYARSPSAAGRQPKRPT